MFLKIDFYDVEFRRLYKSAKNILVSSIFGAMHMGIQLFKHNEEASVTVWWMWCLSASGKRNFLRSGSFQAMMWRRSFASMFIP